MKSTKKSVKKFLALEIYSCLYDGCKMFLSSQIRRLIWEDMAAERIPEMRLAGASLETTTLREPVYAVTSL